MVSKFASEFSMHSHNLNNSLQKMVTSVNENEYERLDESASHHQCTKEGKRELVKEKKKSSAILSKCTIRHSTLIEKQHSRFSYIKIS